MSKASKGTQSSSESTQQLVQISQTVDETKQVLLFPKLPFGLAIFPNELCTLKAIYCSMVARQSKTKYSGQITHNITKDTVYAYRFITTSCEFSNIVLDVLAKS